MAPLVVQVTPKHHVRILTQISQSILTKKAKTEVALCYLYYFQSNTRVQQQNIKGNNNAYPAPLQGVWDLPLLKLSAAFTQ